jgi:hypothetical protein
VGKLIGVVVSVIGVAVVEEKLLVTSLEAEASPVVVGSRKA